MWTLVFVVLFSFGGLISFGVSGDNFPSLLSANATLAVVIDREYMGDDFDNTKDIIEKYLIYSKREIFKHGGVNVQYFSWTSINVKRDITAILSIASCSDTWKLFKNAKEENLLHMAISDTDCPRLPPSEALTVPIIKLGEEIPQLILDVRTVEAYRWTSVIVLYDDTLSRDMVARVVSSLTKESTSIPTNAAGITLVKLETSPSTSLTRDNIKNKLSNLPTKLIGSNFLAIVSYSVMEVMMDVAKSLKLVNTKNQWLYVISTTDGNSSDVNGVKRLLKEGDNVSFLYNNTVSGDFCKGGLQCHIEEILEAFSKSLDAAIVNEQEIAALVSDEEWEAIRPTKNERRDFLLKRIKEFLTTDGVCDNCTSWKFTAGDTWAREYQDSKSESLAGLINVGLWRPSDGTHLIDELFPHIAHGFRGRTLPMVTFNNPPWQIVKVNESGYATEYSGVVFDVIKELARNLNFTFSVHVSDYFTQKVSTSNRTEKTFTDLSDMTTNVLPESIIEMVRSKKAAIGACGFTVTDRGKQVVNYTTPLSTQSYTFVVARPKVLSRALLFMSPFTRNAWFCIGATIILMGPILFIIHSLSPVYEYKGISKSGGLSSIQNCIWYMYGAILQQGGMHLPYADSARLIVGTWWLVVLVLATTYCGNLVAFLTFPKIDIPITTVDDLLAHRETMTWSISRNSFLEEQLKAATDPKYMSLYKGMMTKDLEYREMHKSIEEGKHVFFDWKIRLHYIMRRQFLSTDRCDLALASEDFCDEQIAMIMSPDTPYLQTINEEIRRLHQVGLIQKWLSDYLPKKDRCFRMKHSEVQNHTVNMDDMQGSFFVMILGFSIGLLLVIIEKCWFRYHVEKKTIYVEYTQ